MLFLALILDKETSLCILAYRRAIRTRINKVVLEVDRTASFIIAECAKVNLECWKIE